MMYCILCFNGRYFVKIIAARIQIPHEMGEVAAGNFESNLLE